MVEPLAGTRRRGPQPLGGDDDVTTKAGVLGDLDRIGVLASPQHPTCLAMQQGTAGGRRARDQSCAHELVPEPEGAALVDEQAASDGPLDVNEQIDHRAVQHHREHVQVQPRTDDCRAV